jgi:hypothetical protein
MRCRVNNQVVDSKVLARRPMNYGQAFPAEKPALSYEISLPTAEFVATLRDAYQKAVEEEMADAPYHQRGEWPLLDRLQDLGYPPLEQMIVKQPDLLADLLREWLDMETLDRLIPGSATDLPTYIVNSVDGVVIDQDQVHIHGQAYHHPALVNQS